MTSRAGDGRVGRVGRVVGSLVAVTLSVAFIGWGVHHLWAVDSGITAPVAIVDCGSPGRGGDRSWPWSVAAERHPCAVSAPGKRLLDTTRRKREDGVLL
jgi:hypothetical protein